MTSTSTRRDRAVLGLAWLAAFLPMLDTSIVNLSLPQLGTQFGVTTSQLGWVVGAYLLPVAVAMLAVGRLGDAFGHRRMLSGGGVLFALGAALAAAAQAFPDLLAGRVVQGLGASAMLTLSMAVVTGTFVGEHRARALGVYLSGPAFGGAVGPILGGILTDLGGWRLIFLVQIPLTVVVIAMTRALVRPRSGPRPRLDLPGLALATLALAGVNVALLQANDWGWASPQVGAAWLTAFVAAVAFVAHVRRSDHPVLRLELFRNRAFVVSAVAGAAVWFSITSGFVLLPIYLERGRGSDPLQAALLIAAWPLAALAVYPFASRLATRFGTQRVLMGSLVTSAAAAVALALLGYGTPLAVVPIIGVFLGVTTALLQVTSASGAIAGFAVADAGMASAVFNSIRQIGSSLGGALPAAVYDLVIARSAGHAAILSATQASFAARAVVMASAPLAIAALVRSGSLRTRPRVLAPAAAVEEERQSR